MSYICMQFISAGFTAFADTLSVLMPMHSYRVKKQFVMLPMGHAPHVYRDTRGAEAP